MRDRVVDLLRAGADARATERLLEDALAPALAFLMKGACGCAEPGPPISYRPGHCAACGGDLVQREWVMGMTPRVLIEFVVRAAERREAGQ